MSDRPPGYVSHEQAVAELTRALNEVSRQGDDRNMNTNQTKGSELLFRFRIEAQEPHGWQLFVQLRPPEWWADETGTHDGLWRARDEFDALAQFHAAYPNRHPNAADYIGYSVERIQ